MADYKLTVEDIRNLQKEVSEHQSEQSQESFADKAGNFAKDYGIAALGTHAAAAPVHLAENVANLPKELLTHPQAAPFWQKLGKKIPDFKAEGNLNPENLVDVPDTSLNRAAGFVGDVVGLGGAENRVARGVNALTRVGARTPLWARALRGAGQGYVTGNEDQPGGRLGNAALGGIAPYIYGLSKTQLGQKAVHISDEIRDRFNGLYDSVLHRAEQGGAHHAPVPRNIRPGTADMRDVRHFGTRTNQGRPLLTLDRYLEQPTLENAHRAQSALGQIDRHIQADFNAGRNTGNAGHNAQQAITNWRDAIRRNMQNEFRRTGNEQLGHEYTELSHEFAQEGNHFKHPTINANRGGTASYADVATDLMNDRAFMRGRGGHELPGIRARQSIEPLVAAAKKVAPYAGVVGTLGLAGVTLPHYIEQLLEHMKR